MMKRLLPLALVIAAVFLLTPSAQAAVCYRCRYNFVQECWACQQTTLGDRFEVCEIVDCQCAVDKDCVLGPHPQAAPSLASEYTVASVERLDDKTPPQQPNVPLVASAR